MKLQVTSRLRELAAPKTKDEYKKELFSGAKKRGVRPHYKGWTGQYV